MYHDVFSVEHFFLTNFHKKISDVFYTVFHVKVKLSFGHISGMVGPIDMKRKGRALVGYWVNNATSTFDLTHDLDLGFFKVKFQNNCTKELLSEWCETKKESRTIRCWAGCIVVPFDHTDPWPWPWSFNVNILNSLISGMGGMIDMEGKGCESTFHDYDCDLWITMVGWVDVPDSVQLREC